MAAEWRIRARAGVAPLIFLALTGYFVLNALEGPHGLLEYAADGVRLEAAQKTNRAFEAERRQWEIQVAALRTDHLDADMLDERARAMLNLVNPADIVVFYAPGKKLY
ncbi:MAG: FtsB family cell division protein [Acetobacteraceae bacterium]